VEFYRHYLTQEIDALLQQTIVAYQEGNTAQGDVRFAKVTQLTQGLDLLLGLQQESLATWIDGAKAYGTTPEESLHYATNAKMQVTVWGGPKLKDYASKAWQGMYKDFYLPRWSQFFTALKKSATTKSPFAEAQVRADIENWERVWVNTDEPYVKIQPEDPLALMTSLLNILDQ
jgi:alpha-N-acetylglucosaminidase